MKIKSIISTIAISVLSVGCIATIPTVPANGKYAQTFLKGEPAFEIEYPDAASCATDMNQTRLFNAEIKKALIEGTIKFECSQYPLTEKLKHAFEVEVVLTGKKFPARAVSYDACIILNQPADKSMKYHC